MAVRRAKRPKSYRVFFLSESHDGLGLASPYYPSVVATPNTLVQGERPAIEQVIDQLGAVLESGSVPSQDKQEAVYALDGSDNPAVVRVLKRSAEVQDVGLRACVAAALLKHGDTSTLPFAQSILLNPAPSIAPQLLHNLAYSIREGVRDESAVPTLAKLLRATNAETRRAAASALANTGSTSAIDPLLVAVDDPDPEVQFYGAVGLAEVTGQMEWRPSTEDFRSSQAKYVEHWRQWARTRE